MLALPEADQNGKLSAPEKFELTAEPGVITATDVAEATARCGLTAEQGARCVRDGFKGREIGKSGGRPKTAR
jgi:hypothetical protein